LLVNRPLFAAEFRESPDGLRGVKLNLDPAEYVHQARASTLRALGFLGLGEALLVLGAHLVEGIPDMEMEVPGRAVRSDPLVFHPPGEG
jgi:hypothetical protein